jgi:hypothetical protein
LRASIVCEQVVLDGPAAEDAWLDPEVDLDAALELVRPLPDGLLDIYPLSPKIKSRRVEGIELLTPLQRLPPAASGPALAPFRREGHRGRGGVLAPWWSAWALQGLC